VVQDRPEQEPGDTPLTDAWWARRIGVRAWFAGEPGVTGHWAPSPPNRYLDRSDRVEKVAESIVEATTIAATKWGKTARFIVVHDPFATGRPDVESVEVIGATLPAVAVRVTGREGKFIDILLLQLPEASSRDEQQPVSVTGDESFVFANHAYLRIKHEEGVVEAAGDLRAIRRLKVGEGVTKLTINGQPVKATVANGVMRYQR
jgi:hypothetical protein